MEILNKNIEARLPHKGGVHSLYTVVKVEKNDKWYFVEQHIYQKWKSSTVEVYLPNKPIIKDHDTRFIIDLHWVKRPKTRYKTKCPSYYSEQKWFDRCDLNKDVFTRKEKNEIIAVVDDVWENRDDYPNYSNKIEEWRVNRERNAKRMK